MAFHPTAEVAALASWDLTFRVWTVDGRELVRHDADVIASRFSAGGEAVGCIHTDRSVSVWDLHPSREFRTLRVASAGEPVGTVACDRSGKVLLAGTRAGVVLIDMRAGKVAATLPLKSLPVTRASPEGPWIVEEGPGWARPWRLTPATLAAGQVLRIGPPGPKVPLEGSHVHSIQASADGRHLVLQGRQGRIALVEMKEPLPRGLELEHVNAGKVAISPDGRWAASGPVHGRAALVWNFDSAEVVLRQPGRSETMTAAPVFSPDGRWFLISMGEEIVLYEVPAWTAPRWRIAWPEPIQISTPAAFSGDGESWPSASTGARSVWSVRPAARSRDARGPRPRFRERARREPRRPVDRRRDGFGGSPSLDLARIRPALRDLNLDWEGPPRLSRRRRQAAPVRVEIVANTGARRAGWAMTGEDSGLDLDRFRPYLRLLAEVGLDRKLRVLIDPSTSSRRRC